MPRLAYLCLQATIEGQASYAHVHEIIHGLRRLGWEVDLFEPAYKSPGSQPSVLKRIYEFIRVQIRLMGSRTPDVLYIRWHFAAWPTALWARTRGIPVVQEVNGTYADLFIAWPGTRWLAPVFIWFMRSQLRWADAIIAVTPGLAEWCRKVSKNASVRVIANAANIHLFHPGASATISLPEHYVVFFGALARWQEIETMLAATEEPHWPADVKLVIAGDGPEKQAVVRAGKKGKVVYLGVLAYNQMPGVIARSIAGLSLHKAIEGRAMTGLSPLKVYETLACGVPVIVSDIPGQADLVKDGRCGIVIPPGNPRALAEAVTYLYHHPEERVAMGKRGRKLVEREHSWQKRAEETATVLRMVMSND